MHSALLFHLVPTQARVWELDETPEENGLPFDLPSKDRGQHLIDRGVLVG
jgi:hypothetical protein